jgi:hypothetical protein
MIAHAAAVVPCRQSFGLGDSSVIGVISAASSSCSASCLLWPWFARILHSPPPSLGLRRWNRCFGHEATTVWIEWRCAKGILRIIGRASRASIDAYPLESNRSPSDGAACRRILLSVCDSSLDCFAFRRTDGEREEAAAPEADAAAGADMVWRWCGGAVHSLESATSRSRSTHAADDQQRAESGDEATAHRVGLTKDASRGNDGSQ